MKRLIVVFLRGFMVFTALGHPSVDIGVFTGAGTYFGDMTKNELPKSANLAYGAFLRYNFNPRYALRFNVFNGTIGGEGEYESRLWDFNKNVLDISLQFEFNYFKYIVGDKVTPYSTYVFAGVGMQTYNYNMDPDKLTGLVDPSYFSNAVASGPVISPTIPFGLGFKFNLSRRIGLGLELGMRKTFSDKLDDLDDPLRYVENPGSNLDNTVNPESGQVIYTDSYHNNDWTAYAGVHLVYKLIYGNKGWEVVTPKKRILDWGIENNDKNR